MEQMGFYKNFQAIVRRACHNFEALSVDDSSQLQLEWMSCGTASASFGRSSFGRVS